ncbi:MAG TPA: biopolymer transporter ExbD [Flavobacterium sp.]|uniref:biopolymer transporter ExbD n=1 Tax=Flavobacterium sp. TaxID=239 RepID=UPI002C8167D5|nr:biopolymer transporter ExbD [Flavobacterium sp.]HNP32908.1 biopolymer transporter ExbD [Flavobacterium sp.]
MEQDNAEYRLVKTKPRCKKIKPRIDLAAMVSVSFLLIGFYMVTKELSRPHMMDLGLPERCGEYDCCGGCGVDFRRTITLLLDDNNKIIGYRGLLEYPENKPTLLNYGNDIRKSLLKMSSKIQEQTGDRNRGAIVIIKPSKKSNYGNLVDILDEMAIIRIPTYAIVNDFTPDEQKLLASR